MRSEKGFSLIEVIISLALLGIIGVSFLGSLGTASTVTLSLDVRETAKALAETQIEYIKRLDFGTSYTPAPIPVEYAGFTVSLNAAPLRDSNIQKLTVTVHHQGNYVLKLEDYKVR